MALILIFSAGCVRVPSQDAAKLKGAHWRCADLEADFAGLRPLIAAADPAHEAAVNQWADAHATLLKLGVQALNSAAGAADSWRWFKSASVKQIGALAENAAGDARVFRMMAARVKAGDGSPDFQTRLYGHAAGLDTLAAVLKGVSADFQKLQKTKAPAGSGPAGVSTSAGPH